MEYKEEIKVIIKVAHQYVNAQILLSWKNEVVRCLHFLTNHCKRHKYKCRLLRGVLYDLVLENSIYEKSTKNALCLNEKWS